MGVRARTSYRSHGHLRRNIFKAVGSAASNDADVISDRIWEDLRSRQNQGVPIDLKRVRASIEGVDEQAVRKKALKLASSREYKSHVVISGEVRIDGREILIRPRITFANLALRSVHDPNILPSRHDGSDTITFKQRVSSEISDVALFACALVNAGRAPGGNSYDWMNFTVSAK